MERVRNFLAKNLWAQTALSIVVAALLIQLLYPGRSFLATLARVVVISLGGVGVTLAIRRREKRAAGSTDGLVSLDRRLRTGDVPTDPEERRAMRELVDQRLRRTRHRKAALVFLALMFVTITVLTALTAGPRQTIGFSVLTVLFIGWMTYMSNLQDRRLHTMDDALRSGPRDSGSEEPSDRHSLFNQW
ncbi:hypothetical protein V2W30_01865 [Streptomyces sp. Q6]|uniref:Uncharacterized protein n=1 Tax=Streptomyces citrinus TaxID=3118173 RepID=A0ACD5A4X3_9ACTN